MKDLEKLNKLVAGYIRRPTALIDKTPQEAALVAHAILTIAEDAAARKESNVLRDMYWLSASLISCQPEALQDQPIDFIDLYEYITFLDDHVDAGTDPFADAFLKRYRISVVEGISLPAKYVRE